MVFVDELHFGLDGAALPLLRRDLGLTYGQVGLLLGLPAALGAVLEPALLLLGDSRLRRPLLLAGGVGVCLSLLLVASAGGFPPLLFAFLLNFPASGALVGLAQASLMDLSRGRQTHMMARWTLLGSLGAVLGPLALAGLAAAGLSWRLGYLGLALLLIPLILGLWKAPSTAGNAPPIPPRPQALLRNLRAAARDRWLCRWLGLMLVADLLLDGFALYLPLYFTDVLAASAAQAGIALSLFTAAGLAADVLLLPLLRRTSGRRLLRRSALVTLGLYLLWLLIPGPLARTALLLPLGLARLGWWAVLQGEAYATQPDRPATVRALQALLAPLGGGLFWLVGWLAAQVGLERAMWLLLLAPLALLLFTPRDGDGVQ